MKLVWKIYLWVFVALVVLSLLLVGKTSLVDIGWLIALIILVVPTYAYAYGKPYARDETWRAMVVMAITYYIIFTFYLDPKYGAYPSKEFIDYFITIALPFPTFIAALRHTEPKH